MRAIAKSTKDTMMAVLVGAVLGVAFITWGVLWLYAIH
jgi:hypothetical protein